jgi:hypothetical protein
MRFATFIIASGAIFAGIATASAKTNTGGGGDSSCWSCNPIISVDLRVRYVCEATRYAGRKSCENHVLTADCTESGDYCGFFFPPPNPVIA